MGDFGSIWEDASTIIKSDPETLKAYIKAKGAKSRNAMAKACREILEIFRK
jgi:hypothetical protein